MSLSAIVGNSQAAAQRPGMMPQALGFAPPPPAVGGAGGPAPVSYAAGALGPGSAPRGDQLLTGMVPPPRLYLFHGADGGGQADHGRGPMRDFARRLQAFGLADARPLSYNTDSTFINWFAILREQLFGTFSKRLTQEILADLRTRPLAPGQKLSLVGYSLGTKVAANVAAGLAKEGIAVATLALIEPRNGGTPAALSSVPEVGKVVLIENQGDVALSNTHGDRFFFLHVPTRDHFGMIQNPEPGMVRFLADQLR